MAEKHICSFCSNEAHHDAGDGLLVCDACFGWAVRTEQQAGDADAALKTALQRSGGITVDPEALEAARGRDLIRSITPDGDMYLTVAPKGWELYEVVEQPAPEDD